jgi:hypothetical protein
VTTALVVHDGTGYALTCAENAVTATSAAWMRVLQSFRLRAEKKPPAPPKLAPEEVTTK